MVFLIYFLYLFLIVWSVDKLGNKIYDMRDAYQTITENPLEAKLVSLCLTFFVGNDFYARLMLVLTTFITPVSHE